MTQFGLVLSILFTFQLSFGQALIDREQESVKAGKEWLSTHFFENGRGMTLSPDLSVFFGGLKKKPSTSELIDWLKLLMADDIPDEILTNRDPSKAIPPLYGALVKNEQDVHLLERLAFMNRRDSRG